MKGFSGREERMDMVMEIRDKGVPICRASLVGRRGEKRFGKLPTLESHE